jgi:hypothetical protein
LSAEKSLFKVATMVNQKRVFVPSGDYEPPALKELGAVHDLTLAQNKDYGPSDGMMFQGVAIANASP